MFDKLRQKLTVGAAIAAAGAMVLSGCGATANRAEPGSGSAGGDQPLAGVLRIMVPNTAGGGYDTTARAAAKVMDDTKSPRAWRCSIWPAPVERSACRALVNEKGNGKLFMMMGLGVVGAQYTNKSQAKLTRPRRSPN